MQPLFVGHTASLGHQDPDGLHSDSVLDVIVSTVMVGNTPPPGAVDEEPKINEGLIAGIIDGGTGDEDGDDDGDGEEGGEMGTVGPDASPTDDATPTNGTRSALSSNPNVAGSDETHGLTRT